MPYRIAGIDVHKKLLAVVVSDVEIESEFQFERRMLGAIPNNCARWRHGLSSKGPRKWLWNQPPNTGNQFGERWNGIGSRCARNEKVYAVSRERCIWHKRCPIAGGADGREISSMPNAW